MQYFGFLLYYGIREQGLSALTAQLLCHHSISMRKRQKKQRNRKNSELGQLLKFENYYYELRNKYLYAQIQTRNFRKRHYTFPYLFTIVLMYPVLGISTRLAIKQKRYIFLRFKVITTSTPNPASSSSLGTSCTFFFKKFLFDCYK